MKLLRRLVEALERIAGTLDNDAITDRETLAVYVAMKQQQVAAIALGERQVKAQEEWRLVEREHMKVCERRFQARLAAADQSAEDSVPH